ncbi:PLP-dependent aminotransferase family protein [Sneathiella glossodoripedis]|uniref:aminotransferase-like domain-containing protein n=1 Tax=Sneathiella glossodoripedis TaxID=418853 RepID=UPI000471AB3E|nr:PLP-dependent aminotransferase family protein [Sneathiella glossodoripedis]
MSWTNKFSEDARAIEASEIRELLKILADPNILSFAGGIPDPELFPMADISSIRNTIELDPVLSKESMQYSATEGYMPLREWIAERCTTENLALTSDNILVTSGAQQSLTLLAAALMDPDLPVAVADPTYLGALQVFMTRRPKFVTVQTDEDGLIPSSLEEAFKAGARILYTIPDFQNPGGMTIPLDRRREIVELAHKYDVVILEDTAYRTLYYDGPAPASLLEVEGDYLGQGKWQSEGLVIQVGTASKTLMPALRVGWTIAPKALFEKLVILKQANDLQTSCMNQMMAFKLFSSILDDHVQKLREVYGERRDAMVKALRRYLPNNVRFTEPAGGMFVWLQLPDGLDAKELLAKSLESEKIAFVPGAAFHATGTGKNTLRLSFSTCKPPVIDDAMRRLANLIAAEERRRVA